MNNLAEFGFSISLKFYNKTSYLLHPKKLLEEVRKVPSCVGKDIDVISPQVANELVWP